MRAHEEVEKNIGHRLEELIQSLFVIRDSLELVRKGERHQLIPLYGQLRALLCDKSQTKNKPLLRSLAESVDVSLDVHCMPGVDDPRFPEELRESLVFHLSGFPVTLRRQLPAQITVALEDFIERDILHYKERRYSVRNIIDWFANQAGGAHFSLRAPRDFLALLHV